MRYVSGYSFILVGLNHRTAPLEIREKLSFPSSHLPQALLSLFSYPSIRECAILSTCNRVEIYGVTEKREKGFNSLVQFIREYQEMDGEIEIFLYFLKGEEVVRHLFRVAASLDSMIVGENQILHQVKEAYLTALKTGTAGKSLTLLFQEALRVGRKVRRETDISKGSVSISSAAVKLMEEFLGELRGKRVMIVGAGKMGEITVRALAKKGIRMVMVANRTYEKARRLAQIFQGEALHLDNLSEALKYVDIVISSTRAPHFIIREREVKESLKHRNGKPLFLMDLGIPRNIEEAVANLPGVYLFNIDHLKKISKENLRGRLEAAKKAEKIVEREKERFLNKLVKSLCIPEKSL